METMGVTVKSAAICWPPAPEAFIVSRPPGAAGMVIFAVHTPSLLAATVVFAVPGPTVTETLSLALKSDPRTLKVVPGGPLAISRFKSALIATVISETLAVEVWDPEARRLYEPVGGDGSGNDADQEPSALAEMLVATDAWSRVTVMPLSLAPKPEPVTVIEAPGSPPVPAIEIAGVTVKSMSTGTLTALEAWMVKRPVGAGGIVTLAVHTPRELAEALNSVKPLPAVTVTLSPGLKPEPRTSTTDPGAPFVRSRLNPAPRVSVTAGTLPTEVSDPEALAAWEPEARDGTTREAVQEPLASAEIPVATGVESMVTVIAVSFLEKPDPVAVTKSPGATLRRSSESLGVTVKVF